MLLLRHPARDKYTQVPDGIVDGVDDGLLVGQDVVIVLVAIDDPADRLLRRGDIVPMGGETDDR